MSRSVDLFVATGEAPEIVAEAAARLSGFQVESREPGRWTVRDGDVAATLREHSYCDDGELLLSKYRYAFSAAVPDGVRPQDTAPAALLRRLAQKLQEGTSWPVLMVLDLQYRDSPSAASHPERAAPGNNGPTTATQATGTPAAATPATATPATATPATGVPGEGIDR